MFVRLSQSLRRTAAVACVSGAALAGGCAPQVSTQQEVAMGQDYARQLNRQLPLINDGASLNYLNQIGRQIARNADPRGIQYNFYLVNSAAVNAFAVPGGQVYVNRGLIERADNFSELAGVLGHEIGHVVERHSIEQWQRAQQANMGLGLLYGVLLGRNPSGVEQAAVQLGGGAVFAGYGRDAEREADAVAIPYLIRTGINPNGMVTFFQKLLQEQQRAPSRVEQWFSTHPLTQERVNNTRAAIQATPGANSPQLTVDTQAFQSFKARVRALQPQPSDRR
ncbi:MAG TPA: M48 family metallopeptidase [Longimicrobium sp.]|nr:M48 family metallopeptidase [Longimicrobium sp.]